MLAARDRSIVVAAEAERQLAADSRRAAERHATALAAKDGEVAAAHARIVGLTNDLDNALHKVRALCKKWGPLSNM